MILFHEICFGECRLTWCVKSTVGASVFSKLQPRMAQPYKSNVFRPRSLLHFAQRRELEEKRQEIIREREREAQRIAQELQQHKELERQKEVGTVQNSYQDKISSCWLIAPPAHLLYFISNSGKPACVLGHRNRNRRGSITNC